MPLVKEKSNISNITRYYCVDGIETDQDVANWIHEVTTIEGLVTDYIDLSDLTNRSDEGSGNKQLDLNAMVNTIEMELSERNIDIVSIVGRYRDKPVVLGIELKSHLVFITLRKRNLADIDSLEKKLELI